MPNPSQSRQPDNQTYHLLWHTLASHGAVLYGVVLSGLVWSAVRFGAWVKRNFSLKPALERIREGRTEARNPEKLTMQVERMR